jgi:two-component system, NarL family, nitrate/nitrite response regulator NarL
MRAGRAVERHHWIAPSCGPADVTIVHQQRRGNQPPEFPESHNATAFTRLDRAPIVWPPGTMVSRTRTVASREEAIKSSMSLDREPTVLIASHSPRIRSCWRQALDAGFVVGEVKRWKLLARSVAAIKPGVLLLDTMLPGYEGLPSLDSFRRLSPYTSIILLTDEPDERDAIGALTKGARGICRRHLVRRRMLQVVEKVREGEIWISRRLIAAFLDEVRATRKKSTVRLNLSALTPREREIAGLVAEGYANRRISNRLKMSEKTVKAHLTRMFRKLRTSNRVHLALLLARPDRSAATPADT